MSSKPIWILFLCALSQLAQETAPTHANPDSRDNSPRPARIEKRLLHRPVDFSTLSDYARLHFSREADLSHAETLLLPNGHTQLRFSRLESNQLYDYELTDLGTSLQLEVSVTPAFVTLLPPPEAETPLEHTLSSEKSLTATESVQSIRTCGNLTSPGNPYPCCGSGAKQGNCTFSAWEMARLNWGLTLPMWGNASQWIRGAADSRFPLSSAPALFSIGVIGVRSGYSSGHVGWVTSINGRAGAARVSLNDQWCILTGESRPQAIREYPASHFSSYILHQHAAQTPFRIASREPSILNANSSRDQIVSFSLAGSFARPGMKAIITFPSGWISTLEPTAQIWLDSPSRVATRMLLRERGRHAIQFFNPDGSFSRIFFFLVL